MYLPVGFLNHFDSASEGGWQVICVGTHFLPIAHPYMYEFLTCLRDSIMEHEPESQDEAKSRLFEQARSLVSCCPFVYGVL